MGVIVCCSGCAAPPHLIQPLQFINGEVHAISWTTLRPGGFTGDDSAALEAIRRPLARVVEVYGLRRLATTLLGTYVGRDAGERILQGQIRRGDVERIDAVILLSDLREFTAQSDRLPGEAVIGLLNSYFDCLVPALHAHGGEVLKFVGDGLLGILPVAADPAAACCAALAAAGEARATLAQTNAERAERGEPRLRYGVALHLGEVLYGNIGSTGRLDFTTTGPAVNLTARLETLARSRARSRGFRRIRASLPPCPDHARRVPAARLPRTAGGVRPGGRPDQRNFRMSPHHHGCLAANIKSAKQLISGRSLGSFGFHAQDFVIGVSCAGNIEPAGQP